MTKIITITLCPAFDVHCFSERFEAGRENLASITSREAGGKGINISRALTENDIQNHAIIALGEENASDFEQSLINSKISYTPIYRNGRIRENLTVHSSQGKETRISFSGFHADNDLLIETEEILNREIGHHDAILTFTGRIPNGISIPTVKDFLKRQNARGRKLVIDSKSLSRQDLLEICPWLIKPNEEEIAEYSETALHDEHDLIHAAQLLFSKGIENVMITLGANGAILASSRGIFRANSPSLQVASTIGAGDSSIAGFLAAYQKGACIEDCFRNAIAYGSAACLTVGTNPPTPEEIKKLYEQICIEMIH